MKREQAELKAMAAKGEFPDVVVSVLVRGLWFRGLVMVIGVGGGCQSGTFGFLNTRREDM